MREHARSSKTNAKHYPINAALALDERKRNRIPAVFVHKDRRRQTYAVTDANGSFIALKQRTKIRRIAQTAHFGPPGRHPGTSASLLLNTIYFIAPPRRAARPRKRSPALHAIG